MAEYYWSDGNTNQVRAVDQAGFYWVRTRPIGGCFSERSDSVEAYNFDLANPPALSQVGSQILCGAQDVKISASTPPRGSVIAWTLNQTPITFGDLDTLTVDFPGVIQAFYISLDGGCTSALSQALEVSYTNSTTPVKIQASKTFICSATDTAARITLSAANTYPGVYYTWFRDGELLTYRSRFDTIEISQPGTYYLYSFSSDSCGSKDSIVIINDVSHWFNSWLKNFALRNKKSNDFKDDSIIFKGFHKFIVIDLAMHFFMLIFVFSIYYNFYRPGKIILILKH
jgi:hypothetical protein